jgi:hypothetical protein
VQGYQLAVKLLVVWRKVLSANNYLTCLCINKLYLPFPLAAKCCLDNEAVITMVG